MKSLLVSRISFKESSDVLKKSSVWIGSITPISMIFRDYVLIDHKPKRADHMNFQSINRQIISLKTCSSLGGLRVYLVEKNRLIFVGLIASILSILALAIYSQWEINKISLHFHELGHRSFRKQYMITKLDKLMDTMVVEEERFLITGNPNFKTSYTKAKGEINDVFRELIRYFPKETQGHKEILEIKDLSTRWQQYIKQHERTMLQRANRMTTAGRAGIDLFRSKETIDIIESLQKKVEQLNFALYVQRMERLKSLGRMNRNLAIRNWLLMGIAIVLVGIMEAIALMRLWKLERTKDYLRENEAKLQATVVELQEATRLKSEFLSNVSHEIRTPLNAILGFVQAMQRETYGPLNDKQKNRLTYVYNGGRHLLSLINDILDLSKVEAGKMDLEITPFSMSDLLQSSLNIFQEKAHYHNIDLLLESDKNMSPITGDKRKIQQIVYNLLSNALKFTPPGGRIALKTTIIADNMKISESCIEVKSKQSQILPNKKIFPGERLLLTSVRDTGIGIPTSELENIFEPFRQADGSHIRKFEGSGLGLSLVKRFVELHGGTVWAESSGPEKGSVFFFTLPWKIPVSETYAKN